jgi:uncharacterized protein YndB with AHSA1/START domain
MELKTNLHAPKGTQDIMITREFDLPLELLFKAYEEPELVEQWMGTKVIKLENYNHGSYRFETSDARGNIVFKANGVIHSFVPDVQIIRTFEMEGTPFPVQLEFLDFKKVTDDTSQLHMQIIYRSAKDRAQMLQLPFAAGLNMAHNRLQEILKNLK